MRATLRIVAILGVLVAVAIIAVVVALATIDINALAGPLRERVREATGREFAVGTIALTRSLTPRLVLENVAVANAPWGKAPQLLTARRLAVQVRLLPLLGGRVDVVRLELDDPVVALETDRHGRRNWSIESRHPAGPATVPAPGTASSIGALTLGNLIARRGVVTYRDDASGRVTTISLDTLGLSTQGADAAVHVDLRGTVDGIAVELDGDLGPLAGLRTLQRPQPVRLQGKLAGEAAALSAKVSVDGASVRLDDVDIAYGSNRVTGRLALASGAARPRLEFKLSAGVLTAAGLPLLPGARAAPPSPAPAPAGRRYIFAPTPVDLAPLASIDAAGDLAVERLALRDGRALQNLRAHVAIDGARAEISNFAAAVFGGNASGRLAVDARRSAEPQIVVHVDAKGFDLGALLAAAGAPRDVRGGKTDVTLELTMHGTSPRQWASTVSGIATAIVGPATLANAKTDLSDAFNRLADFVNPFRGVDATTELQCAVIRLPFASGIARVDRSIAVQTSRVGVAASGTIDLRNETLDLAIKPRGRAGVPVDLVQLADLVRVRGPLSAPAIGIDAKGSAETLARLGAAYASDGLAVLGESLLTHDTGGDECATALGRAPPAAARSASPPAAAEAKSPVEDLGKALGRLLHR
jgi:uncharacterized protein involved in outer membrane biogenesis